MTKPAVAAKRPGRRPGRPSGSTGMDKATVISVALQLTRTVALSEVSVVLVARELGVAPALIHYYLGGRDPLTSGVMNAFWRSVVDGWPLEVGDWVRDLEVVAEALYRALLRYPGIASYVISQNKFRVLQDVADDEIDYGMLFLEKFTTTVRRAGFDPMHTGVYAHLMLELVTSYAHATVSRRWPGQHSDYLKQRIDKLDPATHPSMYYVRDTLTGLNGSEAFAVGLRLMLNALEGELRRRSAQQAPQGAALARR
ncbi:MAG TPA: TetR/AcrR family transcriptional regulator C-terminal domain-containing protein [Ramlibacter sp.]|nr:TetR/AcrR family transcriptional regulator C-terminal domain-containing protein [Ramlibacter sp.]